MEENRNSNSYIGFAQVYDMFMDNIPYGEWSLYVEGLLREYGIDKGIVVDLGCGTGTFTACLSKAGYEMIGIDNSLEMLQIARRKAEQEGLNILFLEQKMQEMELFGTVAACVSICDSMNYMIEEKDLLQTFRLVNNYLEAGGIFIFDLNTKYKYETILSQNTFAENREDGSFIWENYYNEQEQMNEYDLTLYIKDEDNKEEDIFFRFDEEHYQKAYELDKIKELLVKAGMEFVAVYDAFTKEPPKLDSERLYIIAREKRQAEKYYVEDK